MKAGKLKSSPQQSVSIMKTDSGQEVIVIEPANPQVVYVPQYNAQAVYTQAPTSYDRRRPGRQQRRDAAVAAGHHRLHGGHRHRRRDGQRLLLRALRLGTAAPHVPTTTGTTTTTIARTRARTGTRDREDVREDVRDNRRGRRARMSRTTGDRRPWSQRSGAIEHPAATRGSKADAPADPSQRRRRRAAAGAQTAAGHTERPTGTTAYGSYEAPRTRHREPVRAAASRAQRHEVGRVLRLLQRQLDAIGQPAGQSQPARRAAAAAPAGDPPTMSTTLAVLPYPCSRWRRPPRSRSRSPSRHRRTPRALSWKPSAKALT